jgi:hypothetical protein
MHSLLTSILGEGEWVYFTLRQLYPRGKVTRWSKFLLEDLRVAQLAKK